MTTLGMAKRLPELVLEIMRLAWQVDRAGSAALLACQVVSAVLGAAGLLATNRTIVALISSGHITAKLWHAAPPSRSSPRQPACGPCSASPSPRSPRGCPRCSPGRPRSCCSTRPPTPNWPPTTCRATTTVGTSRKAARSGSPS
ncbi:hypothetical protein ACFQZC_08260 [Streptacidiphilus monticola]